MPFLLPLIPAIATVGAAVVSSNAAGKAQDKALSAQNTATQESLAAQKAALDRITGLQQPFIDAGSSALPGIAARVAAGAPNFSAPSYARPQPSAYPAAPLQDRATGVPDGSQGFVGGKGATEPPQPAAPSAGAPPAQAPSPDWNAYLQANPDVAAATQQLAASGVIGPNGQWKTPQEWAAFQYQNTGQSEGRALPMTAPSAGSATTPATPPQPLDLGTASPVVADYARPNQGVSPDASQFVNPANFTASPDYQWRLDQGLRNTNASFGAKGLLQSGAALQGFNDYAQNSASQEYNNWFNRQQQLYTDASSRYNTDLANTNNNFNNDRSYGTNLAVNNRDFANNQYNTQTQNMFQLAGIGANAANSVGSAVSGNANNQTNLFTQQGNNTANAALANGQTQAGLAGTVGSTIGNLFGAQNYSSGTPLNLQTSGGYGGNLTPQAVPNVPSGSLNTGIQWTPY